MRIITPGIRRFVMKLNKVFPIVVCLIFTSMTLNSALAEKKFEWPDKLVIVTGRMGSSSNTSISSLAPAMEKLTGMKVRVLPVAKHHEKYNKLSEGKADLLVEASGTLQSNITGQYGSVVAKKFQTRIVWNLMDAQYAFFTRKDSDIKSLYDIKKKKNVRVAVAMSGGSPMTTMKEGLPAFLGLTLKELEEHITWVPASSWPESVRTIAEGSADIAYT